jgi:hypothetical protein
MIFVFGSNLAGRHGKGAAKAALNSWGAIYGQGEGRQGNSYAIPTKDKHLQTLDMQEVWKGISTFLEYAEDHPEEWFMVTPVGSGLAGISRKNIANMFNRTIPENVLFSGHWFSEEAWWQN